MIHYLRKGTVPAEVGAINEESFARYKVVPDRVHKPYLISPVMDNSFSVPTVKSVELRSASRVVSAAVELTVSFCVQVL